MNPLWGAPRIHGELLKLGIDVCEATVAKYMARCQRPPSQTWRTFLANHIDQIAAADFFVVPTITYRLLFVLVILAHQRRRVTHVAVTAHPTAAWTAQQLREVFPEDTAPRFLIHDRDHAFFALAATASGMGVRELRTAPRSPWQNAYAERVIGSIRRGCLDHVIVVNETGLSRILTRYLAYYHQSRSIFRWAKTRHNPGWSRHQHSARSWPFHRSVACTIGTTAAPRNHILLPCPELVMDRSALASVLSTRAQRSASGPASTTKQLPQRFCRSTATHTSDGQWINPGHKWSFH